MMRGLAATATLLAFLPMPVIAQAGQAAWADRVVDSIGVNVHLHYDTTPYVTRWDGVRSLLLGSGIRHVRDGLVDTTWHPYYDHLNQLGARGIGATLSASVTASPALLTTYPRRVNRIDAYEAPNEADHSGDPHWANAVRAFQRTLWTAAKALPTPVAVIGPSLTSAEAYAAVGDLDDVEDFGNMHDYFAGRNPETPGWGAGRFGSRYGSVSYNIAAARRETSRHPVIATETGYTTDLASSQGVPDIVAGEYVPRIVLEHFVAGVPRTFFYELVDEGSGDAEGHFGLVNHNLVPKPAFRALAGMIAELADPGTPVASRHVDVDVSATVSDLRWLVLTKRDRSVIIALWRAAPVFDVPSRRFEPVASADVRVGVRGFDRSRISVREFDDDGALVNRPASVAGAAVRLAVDAHVAFVTFRPDLPRARGTVGHD